ncbi:hypothetical protein HQQ81_09305 [Microbacteriaceae bacterium VKM Ac-2854]|nr:hypothetical protein [Microbacteriaceae bacterium VKM Ac-2854]
MSTALTIAVVLPELLDSNGDAANARVLAARARWAGVAQVDVVRLGEDWSGLTAAPAVVVVGTGAAHDLPAAREIVLANADRLSDWHGEGAEIVAFGGGWELLSEGTQTTGGFVAGAGIFPGHAVIGTERVTDDIIAETALGTVVGFENHLRRFVGIPAGSAFGTVSYGVGNGDGTEGYASGTLLGSHVHGPLLAKNPLVADAILGRVAERIGVAYSAENPDARAADETARAARDVIAKRLVK